MSCDNDNRFQEDCGVLFDKVSNALDSFSKEVESRFPNRGEIESLIEGLEEVS